MTDKRLLEMAAEVMDNSYSPYSLNKVGAAIECTDGSVYTGCYIENAAIGSTICAESAAISAAISAGKRTFSRLAIIAKGDSYHLPCGQCRQILCEFSKNIEILCARASDGRYVSYPLTSLMPLPYTVNDIEN